MSFSPLQVATLKYKDFHLQIDTDRVSVNLDGMPLTLTRKEFQLLALLARNAGQVVSREELLWSVWSYSVDVKTRTLDVHIRRLRQKLEMADSRYIETVFGIGYRFQPCRTAPRAGFKSFGSNLAAVPA